MQTDFIYILFFLCVFIKFTVCCSLFNKLQNFQFFLGEIGLWERIDARYRDVQQGHVFLNIKYFSLRRLPANCCLF